MRSSFSVQAAGQLRLQGESLIESGLVHHPKK